MASIDTETKRISTEEFDDIFKNLVNYFKFKGLTAEVSYQYYKRVAHYPLKALRYAVEHHIEANRPTPANFPTLRELGNLCAEWLQAHPSIRASMVNYVRESDPEYPVDLMIKAHTILKHEGEEAFMEYANETGMPLDDRERVRQRWQVSLSKEMRNGL